MKKTVLVVAMAVISAQAFPAPRSVGVIGIGNLSCGAYVSMDAPSQNVRFWWALGFISGINVFALKGSDILAGQDVAAIRVNINNFCQKNPLEKYTEALEQTAIELDKKANKKNSPN